MNATAVSVEEEAQKKINFMQRSCRDFFFHYARGTNDTRIEDVIARYGLVGVVERFNESMVLLAEQLRLPMADVIHLSSKESHAARPVFDGVLGGLQEPGSAILPSGLTMANANSGKGRAQMKRHLPLEEEHPLVQAHVAGPFKEYNKMDVALHDAATRELERRIAALPEGRWRTLLAEYGRLSSSVKAHCEPPPGVSLQATTKCYWRDNGCGYDCIDGVIGKLQQHASL